MHTQFLPANSLLDLRAEYLKTHFRPLGHFR